jgi:chromosome segregation ATPase
MFSNQDEKDLEKDLEGYLKNFGKTTKPAKNIIRLEKIKKSDFPEELETIDVIFENNKKIQKISFFFLDKNLEILSSLKLKEGEATDFVEQFKKFTIGKLEIKLAQENVRMVESNLNDAKKDQSKIEKSLESNLKDQEKLGKKLDSSPEMLTKVLSEKEEIVGALYNETEIAADKNAKEELEKASSKKEKEIQKIQKEKAKAETKLSKKETEFDALKDELFQAKAMVKSLESVLKDANTVLINLK